MRVILVLLILQVAGIPSIAQCQSQGAPTSCWSWIVPLQTTRAEIEKVFGESVTDDKTHPFQTYAAGFGKITTIFAIQDKYYAACRCVVKTGTVLHFFVVPKNLLLSDLKIDVRGYEKDATYSPRELSYFSESEGLMVTTEIVELPNKDKVEKVVALDYRPKVKSN